MKRILISLVILAARMRRKEKPARERQRREFWGFE